MAETVKVPGIKKPQNKNVIYIGGAVAVGVVGYAWYSRGTADYAAQQKAIDESLPGAVEVPTDTPGFSATGGGPPPGNNADWGELAVQRLMNIGLDAIAVSAAIGKFLQRQPLNTTEASLVEQAIRAAGLPPENGPWVIIRATTPGPVVPPPAAGLLAPVVSHTAPSGSRNIVTYSWPPVPGAVKYRFIHVGGSTGYITATKFTTAGAAAGRTDVWKIAAVNATGGIGPYTTVSVAIPAAGAVAGKPPAAPRSLGVLPLAPGRVRLAWPKVSGATNYRFRWETATSRSAWAYDKDGRIDVTWRFRKGTVFTAVVQAGNKYGWSPIRRGNRATAK
jgi:hypothetical protein